MDDYSYQANFLRGERVTPLWKKQREFVCFLVNAYYAEPFRLMEEEKRAARNGLYSEIPFCNSLFGNDVAEVVGRIAEETLLLDQKHVQDKPPFNILEKPLLVPATIGALLQRIFKEKYGVFVSSTTFDAWASRALGFNIRLTRVWFDADYRVHQSLRNSSVRHLADKRSACDTGVHAIRLQSQTGGPLYSLWSDNIRLLNTLLSKNVIPSDASEKLFMQCIEDSLELRCKVQKKLSGSVTVNNETAITLYSLAEPELCSCITFHSFFRRLEGAFQQSVDSRKKKVTCSNFMQDLFVGCLNSFTMNRYDNEKAATVFGALDAVALLADGKVAIDQHDLKAVPVSSRTSYCERAQLLSCDHISGAIETKPGRANRNSSLNDKATFTAMDTSAINFSAMYSFVSFKRFCVAEKGNRIISASEPLSRRESCEDWIDYSEFKEIAVENGETDLAKYLLSADQRAAKRQIYLELNSEKRQRNS